MKKRLHLSIRRRIYVSFVILVFVLAANSIIALVVLNNWPAAGSSIPANIPFILAICTVCVGAVLLFYLTKRIVPLIIRDNGFRHSETPFKPFSKKDGMGKALLAMRENLEDAKTNLEIKNKELETKNKELEQFAFVASHDLQEPLRTASSFVGLLQQQYKDKLDEKGAKYLDYISQASAHMQALVAGLLEYSRIGSHKDIQNVDCNTVLNEVLVELNPMIAETGAQITAGQLPVVYGYPTELKQLFQNLISNSIKFRQKDIPPVVTISAEQAKGDWQFTFCDNGIGVAKEHYDRIFIIFQRLHTRNHYEGPGIGLSHCKKIVELHNGKMWLESELGSGTTFYFTIPQTA